MKKEKECDGCGQETPRKHLGKIRGKYLCKECRKNKRIDHRKETMAQGREYRAKAMAQSKEAKKGYEKHIARRYRKKNQVITEPKIKGSKKDKKKEKSQSYLTLQEKQMHLKTLMSRGLNFKEAKERIQDILDQQKQIREDMRAKNKSEKQIKEKQKALLEELWSS